VPADARPWVLGLASVVAVAAVVIVVLVATGTRSDVAPRAGGVAPNAPMPDLPFAGTSVGGTPATSTATVYAHAAGAVVRPGVYRLDGGARVADLIAAAGGMAADADADRLNLAAVLTDGVRVYVPRYGELELPVVDEGPAVEDPVAGSGSSAGGKGDAVVDLNRADAAALEELPGVGPSIAAAIIDHRERNGPFRSVDDLLSVRGIGPSRLEDLRPHVRV
jgi:competence protein ComEA